MYDHYFNIELLTATDSTVSVERAYAENGDCEFRIEDKSSEFFNERFLHGLVYEISLPVDGALDRANDIFKIVAILGYDADALFKLCEFAAASLLGNYKAKVQGFVPRTKKVVQ